MKKTLQIIHRNDGLKFFKINFIKILICYYRYKCIFHLYFTR